MWREYEVETMWWEYMVGNEMGTMWWEQWGRISSGGNYVVETNPWKSCGKNERLDLTIGKSHDENLFPV